MADSSDSVSKDSVVSHLTEGVGEYTLQGLLEGEDEGTFQKVEKVGSGSFHKGLPCGVVISRGREDDDEPKKPVGCFCFVASFFSFLAVLSTFGLKDRDVPEQKFLY